MQKKSSLPMPLIKCEQIPNDENEKASCINCSNTHSNQPIDFYSSAPWQ